MKALVLLAIVAALGLDPASALAALTAETAKRCMHYSCVTHPDKRPGSVRGSGDRQAYFRDCMARDGNVPPPASAKP